jgi:hypothetical protein
MIKLIYKNKNVENKIIINKLDKILNDEFSLKRNKSFESLIQNSCEDYRIMDLDTRVNTDIDRYEEKISLNVKKPKMQTNKISRVSFKIMRSMEGDKAQKKIISKYCFYKLVMILNLKMRLWEKILLLIVGRR